MLRAITFAGIACTSLFIATAVEAEQPDIYVQQTWDFEGVDILFFAPEESWLPWLAVVSPGSTTLRQGCELFMEQFRSVLENKTVQDCLEELQYLSGIHEQYWTVRYGDFDRQLPPTARLLVPAPTTTTDMLQSQLFRHTGRVPQSDPEDGHPYEIITSETGAQVEVSRDGLRILEESYKKLQIVVVLTFLFFLGLFIFLVWLLFHIFSIRQRTAQANFTSNIKELSDRIALLKNDKDALEAKFVSLEYDLKACLNLLLGALSLAKQFAEKVTLSSLSWNGEMMPNLTGLTEGAVLKATLTHEDGRACEVHFTRTATGFSVTKGIRGLADGHVVEPTYKAVLMRLINSSRNNTLEFS